MTIYFLPKDKEIKNDQNFIQSKYHIHTTPAFFQYFLSLWYRDAPYFKSLRTKLEFYYLSFYDSNQ